LYSEQQIMTSIAPAAELHGYESQLLFSSTNDLPTATHMEHRLDQLAREGHHQAASLLSFLRCWHLKHFYPKRLFSSYAPIFDESAHKGFTNVVLLECARDLRPLPALWALAAVLQSDPTPGEMRRVFAFPEAVEFFSYRYHEIFDSGVVPSLSGQPVDGLRIALPDGQCASYAEMLPVTHIALPALASITKVARRLAQDLRRYVGANVQTLSLSIQERLTTRGCLLPDDLIARRPEVDESILSFCKGAGDGPGDGVLLSGICPVAEDITSLVRFVEHLERLGWGFEPDTRRVGYTGSPATFAVFPWQPLDTTSTRRGFLVYAMRVLQVADLTDRGAILAELVRHPEDDHDERMAAFGSVLFNLRQVSLPQMDAKTARSVSGLLRLFFARVIGGGPVLDRLTDTARSVLRQTLVSLDSIGSPAIYTPRSALHRVDPYLSSDPGQVRQARAQQTAVAMLLGKVTEVRLPAWTRPLMASVPVTDQIPRATFADLSGKYRIPPAEAIHHLNRWAISLTGEALLSDEGDTILVNSRVYQEMQGDKYQYD
jgi:hypothetical protein